MLAWLDSGGRVNATFGDDEVSGFTVLVLAANGHERVVELLLQRGAEINLQESKGRTALIFAAGSGHERVVILLLQRGAEVNLQSSACLLYTSPSPRDVEESRMPSSA